MSEDQAPTARTRVVREPHRGVYDRAAAYQILDEGFICHVGFVLDGQPFVIPTAYGRVGDNLYIHGSAASRMLRNLDKGIPGVRDGYAARRPGAGPLDFQSLHELPFGGGAGNRGSGVRAQRKTGSPEVAFGAHPARTLGGIASAQRKRTEADAGACACRSKNFRRRSGKVRRLTTKKIIRFPPGRE